MEQEGSRNYLEPDVNELVICDDERYVCETYIFEPEAGEKALGRLFVAGETQARKDTGKELMELVVQAIQKEYYREPDRNVLTSFESALHQANLVLHDAVESGVRDWMGHWHVAVAGLSGQKMHISTAGNAAVFITRNNKLTLVSQDLAYSPITNPLRTFAQVAGGTVAARDVLYLGTENFAKVFRREDLARFAIEHSAANIGTHLHQLYMDQKATDPLAALVITILPRNILSAARSPLAPELPIGQRRKRDAVMPLTPRQPLQIHRSALRAVIAIMMRIAVLVWQWFKHRFWPLLRRGSRHGGALLVRASAVTGRNMQTLAKQGWRKKGQAGVELQESPAVGLVENLAMRGVSLQVTSWPRRLGQGLMSLWQKLPGISKIFAIITLILAIVLIVALVLLRGKRTEDAQIQRASEILHEGQTKEAAAETALIYNNRDQATNLLNEASQQVAQLKEMGLYTDETKALDEAVSSVTDRLQKVMRVSSTDTRVLGDFSIITGKQALNKMTLVGDALYTFNPETNEIIRMNAEGAVDKVTDKTEGIGFFTDAIGQEADKNIILLTDAPGITIFDTKDTKLSSQDISFSSTKPDIKTIAAYGNRLYVYDRSAKNIFSFSKTLTGYSSGTAWVDDKDFPTDNVVSMAIDGSIYTLHQEGTVRELFKGKQTNFEAEKVEPSLAGASKILTREEFNNIYIFDLANRRVVIMDKKGTLQQQIMLDVAMQVTDIAVASDEKTIYALDGTRVLAVPLEQ
ncbi:MAG: hypothetical protein U1E51_05105 [Candidatus Binatia bacterium]|nr:hypothetical protein [Candidatus Binatia bacterium]